MTILFVGCEGENFIIDGGVRVTTTSGRFNSTYSRTAMYFGSTGNSTDILGARSPVFAAQTDVWFHFRMVVPGISSTNYTLFELRNSSGTPVFRLRIGGTGGLVQCQYWDGSAWQNTGSTFSFSSSISSDFDLHVVCGASGSFTLYKDNVSIATGSISSANMDNVAQLAMWAGANHLNDARPCWSELIIATEPTNDWHVFYRAPTGNGNYTTWAGSYTDVNENGYNDADFISGTTNGEKESYTTSARSIGSLEVKGIAVSARALRDTTGPQNLQMLVRNGSTDNFSSNVSGLGTSYGPVQAIFETDPATGNNWSASDAGNATLNFGVQAIT